MPEIWEGRASDEAGSEQREDKGEEKEEKGRKGERERRL
jgi:hypothetical protein